jgi:non-ribosomal peptide synthase protein (TIGR01720 family)
LLELTGYVSDGRLRLNWSYSRNQFQRSTIERLISAYQDALVEVLACRPAAGESLSPHDFPGARVNQQDLNTFLAKVGKAAGRRKK